MHEAGLLAAAVGDAIAAAGPDLRHPSAIQIRIHDPIHLAPEAARLHAELALRAHGFTDVAIEVTADPVECLACGVSNEAHADHPFCAECGWPLPDRGGHAVDATLQWAPTTTSGDPAPTTARVMG